ncbi:MAG: outer membrane lipid asymmetry maintenance protein MlaD [Desulfovibrio sp.]|nr:MAG: outer membrane lipid asymmetry maintenance protein MlaD [Desulfovibrio sp.]
MNKYAKETSVGIFVFIGLICVAYMTVQLGRMEFLGADTYSLTASFRSAAGLRPGAEVEIAGVAVGRVADISLDQKRVRAVAILEIDNDIELYEDAIASIKTSGLIGDKYISLDPGGFGAILADGDVIELTESAIDLEKLISSYVFGAVEDEQP